MHRLPGRRFVLIGDSGELDPEVFAEIRGLFPTQVKRIVIRDVAAGFVHLDSKNYREVEVLKSSGYLSGRKQVR